jgi:hypothetical protein
MACERQEGSQFWRSLQNIKHEIRAGVTYSIGDGAGTLFWLDSWLGERPLRLDVSQLFAIYDDPMFLVATAGHQLWKSYLAGFWSGENHSMGGSTSSGFPSCLRTLEIVSRGNCVLQGSSWLGPLTGPYVEGPP